MIAGAGERRVEATVDEPAADLKGLVPGALHRVEVRRIAADGLRSAPAIGSFVAGPRRVRSGEARFPGRWHGRSGGLGLAGPTAFVEEDPDIVFFLYGALASGGLIHVGSGEKTFRDLVSLPKSGYRPFHRGLRDGDVFAVRTADGRYGKVIIRGERGDYRDGMIARVTFLESGGFTLPVRPREVSWMRAGDRFRLTWQAAEGAAGYVVRIAGAAVVYEGDAPACELAHLPPNQVVELHVMAVHADGAHSEPTPVMVPTFPARYRYGRFTLDSHGGNGWSFTDDGMVGARDAGELFISNSAGGASSLSITGRHGIGRPPGLEWGEMPRPGATGWTERGNEIRTDDRDPPSQRFWARSEEGGVASLRIVHANYPRVTFEYLYYKPVWPPDAAALKDGRLVWKPVDAARSYRVRVDGKVLRTEATEIELPELRRNAFHRIELHAVLENGIESEPYVVETDTYSGSYRVGELEAAAWGANGVSFTHGRAAPPGEELELRLVLATADRLQVIAPYGGTVVSGLGFGSFPARNVKLDLTRDWQVPLAAVPDQVMLVKTADGGLASVAVSILESRGRKLRLRYVVRAPLTLDQALRDIAAAAPEPDAAAGQRARALLGRLRARDPNLRARALDALIRLGLKGARVVLAAREQSNDPDLRAMLERWAMAVYAAELE